MLKLKFPNNCLPFSNGAKTFSPKNDKFKKAKTTKNCLRESKACLPELCQCYQIGFVQMFSKSAKSLVTPMQNWKVRASLAHCKNHHNSSPIWKNYLLHTGAFLCWPFSWSLPENLLCRRSIGFPKYQLIFNFEIGFNFGIHSQFRNQYQNWDFTENRSFSHDFDKS